MTTMHHNNLGVGSPTPSTGADIETEYAVNLGRSAWDIIEDVCNNHVTGELTLTTTAPGRTRVYMTNGLVYFAERETDESLATRLVLVGALNLDQLHKGSIRLNGVEHLGRLFERDATVDRDAVELAVELMTEQTLTEIAELAVQSYRTAMFRHHSSGIARWFSAHHSIEDELPIDEVASSSPAQLPAVAPAAPITPAPLSITSLASLAPLVPLTPQEPVGSEQPEPAPISEVRVAQTPVVEAPVAAVRVIEVPAVETPVVETPVAEAPASPVAPLGLLQPLTALQPLASLQSMASFQPISPVTRPDVAATPSIELPELDLPIYAAKPLYAVDVPAASLPAVIEPESPAVEPEKEAEPTLAIDDPVVESVDLEVDFVAPIPETTPVAEVLLDWEPEPASPPTPALPLASLTPLVPLLPTTNAPDPVVEDIAEVSPPTPPAPVATNMWAAPVALPMAEGPGAPLVPPAPIPPVAAIPPAAAPIALNGNHEAAPKLNGYHLPRFEPIAPTPQPPTPVVETVVPDVVVPETVVPETVVVVPFMDETPAAAPQPSLPSLAPLTAPPALAPMVPPTPAAPLAPAPSSTAPVAPEGPGYVAIPVPEDVAAAVRRAITAIEAATHVPTGQPAVTFGPMHISAPGQFNDFAATTTAPQPIQAVQAVDGSIAPVMAFGTAPQPVATPAAPNGGLGMLDPAILAALGPMPEQLKSNVEAAPITTERRGALRRLIDGIRRRH